MDRRFFNRECFTLIIQKLGGQITRERYIEGTLAFEQKYPNIEPFSFREAAERYREGKRLPDISYRDSYEEEAYEPAQRDFKRDAGGDFS